MITKEEATLLLKKAGWYEGRQVDISRFEGECKKKGIELFDSAKRFLQEFSGIDPYAYFKTISKIDNSVSEYRYDFGFKADVEDIVSTLYYEVILEAAKEECFCLGESGYYYPAITAIGRSGKIYLIHDYEVHVYVFDSLIESIEYELRGKQIIADSLLEKNERIHSKGKGKKTRMFF